MPQFKLSESQVYGLAWAARPTPAHVIGDRPPESVFGKPRVVDQTWLSLQRRGLIALNGDCQWTATPLGVGWLMEHGLYEDAMRGHGHGQGAQ